MTSGSLFTGTGALDMAAAEVLGAEPAWFCDLDPGASALLAHHYPDVPNLGDITAVDWTTVEPVDVLTGGFPCQDISNAGRREGIIGARSGLWSYYADAIRVLRPRYVLIENVAALVVRGLDRVLADLAALGFDAEWATVRASDVGAPHQRERVFIAAARHSEVRGRDFPSVAGQRRGSAGTAGGPGGVAADAGSDTVREQPVAESGRSGASVAGLDHAAAANPAGAGLQGYFAPRSPSGIEPQENTDAERNGGASTADSLEWGPYGPAIRRWEAILSRPAPAPTATGVRGGRVLNPALPEWMMGLPDGWITAVPGLSRAAQLKLAGNGVVTQQAIAAFRHLLALLNLDARSAA